MDQRVEHIWKTQISEGHFGRCFYFVVRKQFIWDSGIKFANTPIYEDQEYVCRLLCNVNNIAYFNYPYYRYMIRGSSLSMCYNLKMSIACVKASASLFRLSKEYLHSPLRQNFIESRALVILSLLGHQILLLSDDEVKTIAETFESEGKPFEYVSLSDQGFPMITAMQAQGCVEGLVAYTKEMKEGILDFISEVDSLYIFGVNTLARGVVRLCQRQGIHIEAILDNNVKGIPTQGLGCKITHPSILEKISSRELAKIKVFIATLDKSNIRKISNQLRSFSIQENQISTLPQM